MHLFDFFVFLGFSTKEQKGFSIAEDTEEKKNVISTLDISRKNYQKMENLK